MSFAFRSALSVLISLSAPALAQGRGAYLNVESPQCKPIAVARVAENDYLLVCNTPDNAVEIYGPLAANGAPFVTRVQTGAEPVSVVWNATRGRFYTANVLGDSITAVGLAGSPLQATLVRTEFVGDEPMHIAFAPDDNSLFVTLASTSAIGRRHWDTLAPFGTGQERIDLVDNVTTPTMAIKDPRTVFAQGAHLFVLGHRGGKVTTAGTPYDFDIWHQDINSSNIQTMGGLGTTNFNMTFAGNGDLYVVGTDAQIETIGEANLRVLPTGFVRTFLYRVQNPVTSTPTITARDLNTDAAGIPVAKTDALTHGSDVLAFPQSGTGAPTKIYVTAFNSDRLGVITVGTAGIATWAISARIPIQPVTSGNPMAGPRAMALKEPNGSFGHRIYVLNRLDNSVSEIDPASDTLVRTFALQRDPTPGYIRVGRQFLYGAQFSGNGMDACASCHVDGRTDVLAWNLSDFVAVNIPPLLNSDVAVNDNDNCTTFKTTFPADKGRLVTQSLQGMVNFESNTEVQALFSNEPLHWRGDRATFLDFNGAFVGLMGMTDIGPPGTPKGITDAQMQQYRDAMFSIVYPPNPEQQITRTYSGSFGTPNGNDGSGALLGMKVYHGFPIGACSGRSCLHCHFLPEGSNNRITEFTSVTFNPLETAALRGLSRKERVLEKGPVGVGTIKTGLFGLAHGGGAASINGFNEGAFGGVFNPFGLMDEVNAFVREFDTGVAPIVGGVLTVTASNRFTPPVVNALLLLEAQAKAANCGLVAQGRIGSATRGFWFDLTANTGSAVYREDASGGTFTSGALLNLIGANDVLVYNATPLGSERRFAWQGTGSPPALPGARPSNITLEPMVPNTANVNIPSLTAAWEPTTFQDPCGFNRKPLSVETIRIFQGGIRNDGPGFAPGLTQLRHEAPRRFQVAGDNIRHGATVTILMSNDPLHPAPNATSYLPLSFPIHPTDQFNATGHRIWQTAVEADPMITYMLVLGGLQAKNVGNTLSGVYTNDPPLVGDFDPVTWNVYLVTVQNQDDTHNLVVQQSIRLP